MSVSVGASSNNYNNYSTTTAQTKPTTEAKPEAKAEQAAVYEKSASDKKATYSINRMSEKDRAAVVQQMKQDQLDRQGQLSSLVQQMLSKQAGVSNLAQMFSPDKLKNVSAADIAQAKEDVSEDGYWGVKQTSQRLFDFASALAGDDVEKMKKMQAAMQKGFEQATKAWGQDLPGISQDTMKAANQMFDDYYKAHGVEA